MNGQKEEYFQTMEILLQQHDLLFPRCPSFSVPRLVGFRHLFVLESFQNLLQDLVFWGGGFHVGTPWLGWLSSEPVVCDSVIVRLKRKLRACATAHAFCFIYETFAVAICGYRHCWADTNTSFTPNTFLCIYFISHFIFSFCFI